MRVIIAVSSWAAASSVGLGIIRPTLHAAGCDVLAAPTTVLGRHPGWGPPGGGRVEDGLFASMLEGLAAHPDAARADAILTGYFASPRQVEAAAQLIDHLKSQRPQTLYICDPVMGDAPKGLYVPADVADAVARTLVPRADVLTPNAWEAGRLRDRTPVTQPDAAAQAAHALRAQAAPGAACAITSIHAAAHDASKTGQPQPSRLGAVLATAEGAWFAHTAPRGAARGGTGDLFAAVLTAFWGQDAAPEDALARAVGVVEHAVGAAQTAPELPRAALHHMLHSAAPAACAPVAAAPLSPQAGHAS